MMVSESTADPAPQQPRKTFTMCEHCNSMCVLVEDENGDLKPRRLGRKLTRWSNLIGVCEDTIGRIDQGLVSDPAAELRKLCNLMTGREPLVVE